MTLKNIIYLVGSITFTLSGCDSRSKASIDESQTPIVSVEDQTLYKGTLDKVVPTGISAEDSTKIADNYIKSWAQDILLYRKAQENIDESDEIKKLVSDYRKSLLINDYQNKLIQEKTSENPNDSEIKDFYDNNARLFTLKDELIKGLYLKIPKESGEIDNLKKLYKLKTDEAIQDIDSKALQNTIAYENFHDSWVYFHEILNNIPIQIEEDEAFLKKNKTIEVSDSSFVYLLNISDYMLAGELAPYEFVKEKAKATYIERKRESFEKELKENLYNDAVNGDQITFYNKK